MQYRIVVDAMGSDNAPYPEVMGAMAVVKANKNIEIILVGIEDKIKELLTDNTNIKVVNATEVISPNEEPTRAIRRKKDASIPVALKYIKENGGDAFVSAGSTGAVLAGPTLLLGRLDGVIRPALAPVIPTTSGRGVVLCDGGATSDAKPEFLDQFAIMGSEYAKIIFNVDKPKVALLNIGAEEKKGSELYAEAHQLLKVNDKINFLGNIEARDILKGDVDVVVAEGFAGNIALKSVEGAAKAVTTMLKDEIKSSKLSMIGALLMKKSLRNLKNKMSYEETGGACLLGVKKPIIKAHGSSDEVALKNAILQAYNIVNGKVVENISKELGK